MCRAEAGRAPSSGRHAPRERRRRTNQTSRTDKKSGPNPAATLARPERTAANSQKISGNSRVLGRTLTPIQTGARLRAGTLGDLSTSRSGVGGAARLGDPTLPPAIIGPAEHFYSRTLGSSLPGSIATGADSIECWTNFAEDSLSRRGTCRAVPAQIPCEHLFAGAAGPVDRR